MIELRPATRGEKIENLAFVIFGGAFSLAYFALIGLWVYRTLFAS